MLSLDERIAALQGCAFFEGLPREALRVLAMTSRPLVCPAGETLFEEGEEDTDAFVLVAGAAEAVKTLAGGRRVELGRFGPGDVVGEFAMLAGVPRSASVVVRQDLTALRVSREAFEELVRAWPEVALRFMRMLVLRQLETRNMLLQLLGTRHG